MIVHRVTVSMVLSLLFVGCAPVYRTFYDYKPMQTASARECSNGCMVLKQQCQSVALQDYNACETRAALEYQACESRKIWGYDAEGDLTCLANCFCLRGSCTDQSGRCEELYKDCYVNCGGTVVATTQCVQNCEEAAPPSTTTYGQPVIEQTSKPKKKASGSPEAKPAPRGEKKSPQVDPDSRLQSMTKELAN